MDGTGNTAAHGKKRRHKKDKEKYDTIDKEIRNKDIQTEEDWVDQQCRKTEDQSSKRFQKYAQKNM